MKKIKLIILSMILMLIPVISLGTTGHAEGCTSTGFDTNCCTKTFSISPKAGYRIVDVIVNGVSQGPITTYTFTNLTGSQTLKVVTELISSGSTGESGTGGSEEVSGYKVQFNANGGTGSMSSQTFQEGTTGKLNICTYTRPGYNFKGWSKTSSGTVEYADGADISVTENMTLYAVWELVEYTITYDLAGGSITENRTTYTVETETFTLNNPTRSGYTFTGWTGSNVTTPSTTLTIDKGSTGNRMYTAQWASLYTINVSREEADVSAIGDNGGVGILVDGTAYTSTTTVSVAFGTRIQVGPVSREVKTMVYLDSKLVLYESETDLYNYTVTSDLNVTIVPAIMQVGSSDTYRLDHYIIYINPI